MFEYDRVDVSESTDTNKTDGFHECIICYNWYFSGESLDLNQKYVIVVMIYYKNIWA